MKLRQTAALALIPAALALAACEPTNPTSPGSCNGRIDGRTVEKVIVPQGATCVLENTRVQANVEVKRDTTLIARGARIGGNIQIVGNRGSNEIRSNRVGGNLQCKENSPPPTGGGNIVDGNKEDQCRRL